MVDRRRRRLYAMGEAESDPHGMTPGYWLEGTAGAAGRYLLTVFRTCALQNAACAPPAAGVNESSPARFATAAEYAAEMDKHDFRFDVQVSQHERLTHKWTRGVDGASLASALHRYPGARAVPLEGKVLIFGGGAPAAVFDPANPAAAITQRAAFTAIDNLYYPVVVPETTSGGAAAGDAGVRLLVHGGYVTTTSNAAAAAAAGVSSSAVSVSNTVYRITFDGSAFRNALAVETLMEGSLAPTDLTPRYGHAGVMFNGELIIQGGFMADRNSSTGNR